MMTGRKKRRPKLGAGQRLRSNSSSRPATALCFRCRKIRFRLRSIDFSLLGIPPNRQQTEGLTPKGSRQWSHRSINLGNTLIATCCPSPMGSIPYIPWSCQIAYSFLILRKELKGGKAHSFAAACPFCFRPAPRCAEKFSRKLSGNGSRHFFEVDGPVPELLFQTRQREAIALDAGEATVF